MRKDVKAATGLLVLMTCCTIQLYCWIATGLTIRVGPSCTPLAWLRWTAWQTDKASIIDPFPVGTSSQKRYKQGEKKERKVHYRRRFDRDGSWLPRQSAGWHIDHSEPMFGKIGFPEAGRSSENGMVNMQKCDGTDGNGGLQH